MSNYAFNTLFPDVTTNSANTMRTSTLAFFTLLSLNLLGQQTWNYENLDNKDLHTTSATMTKCATALTETDESSSGCSDSQTFRMPNEE